MVPVEPCSRSSPQSEGRRHGWRRGCRSRAPLSRGSGSADGRGAGGEGLLALLLLLLILLLPGILLAAPLPERAAELRNLGLAQLENELPAQAEPTFRELLKAAPDDPLPYANLAISALRQQKNDEALSWIDQALAKAPGRADLLAVRGDVLQWSGKPDEALAAYQKAASADPENVWVQYSLYQQATAQQNEAAIAQALNALVRLRPENLVVLLKEGQRAIRAGDRAAATRAFLRVKEILLQPQPTLDPLLKALETNDLEAARIPAVRLENVLKVTLPYQQSLRELSPGIQGLPVERFAGEPPPSTFGDPVPVKLRATRLDETPTTALAVGDFNGDGKMDTVRILGIEPKLSEGQLPAPGITGLLAADLDNDGRLDLIGHGAKRAVWWRGKGDGSFEESPLTGGGEAAAVIDYDIEGDLDLALGSGVFRNNLTGPLEAVEAMPKPLPEPLDLVPTDLDRDGDLDLALAHAGGVIWLDNLRQGRFEPRTIAEGKPFHAVESADLDNDGKPELIAAGPGGLAVWRNRGGSFETVSTSSALEDVLAFDVDNDGRLDLAAIGPSGLIVLGQDFKPLPIEGAAPGTTLVSADLDADGDLDLLTAGPSGLYRVENDGGNKNHWLTVRLKALTQGSGKNNVEGLGSVLEVRAGTAYQFREATGQVTHFGLGRKAQPDLLRVTWTNGVPQNRIQPKGDQRIVEEQVLKGSCPFLYAWDGERFAFVTDLLWNAPIGLPVAPGAFASSDPSELVRIDGLSGDRWELRITEELWEAAFFDAVRLWVVDHPPDVEVASNLKVIPGKSLPEEVKASRDLRPVTAWDGAGEDATARVRTRDEVYAGGYPVGNYQGVAARPWTFTIDLGEAPASPVRLHLDGWIFPADASLNLAVAQRPDLPPGFPKLEVETAAGWQVLVPEMGFPAGKTKTMVVDTPPLPEGARRLRIVTNQWLAWDRIAWTMNPVDEEAEIVAQLSPETADLRYRGFSELVRRSPNGPHGYNYHRATETSPWLPFPGRYTRYGDVRELLETPDDRSVILAPGDEIAVTFSAEGLPPVPEGWKRTLFLESHGWDKDADRNTFEPHRMEPLPFRSMKRYGDPFPETPGLKRYVEEWLTREVR
ncbi:MAG TPA: FG-GAP-like repeat-containing protein [Thermoanaerobaculia bacterium]|nr:FG-GAP-like repeat-containing protein [Thermoanaerobaculia bacterium]